VSEICMYSTAWYHICILTPYTPARSSTSSAPPRDKWPRCTLESNCDACDCLNTSSFSACVAVCCGVLRCVAVCCCVLRCVAVCCSVLQRVEVCDCMKQSSLSACIAVCCSVMQCVAVRCSVLRYVAAFCGVRLCENKLCERRCRVVKSRHGNCKHIPTANSRARQLAAKHCSTLQQNPTACNGLQQTENTYKLQTHANYKHQQTN